MTQNQRRWGVDLLRLTAMGMILMHHLLTHGGLTNAFPALSATSMACRLLNTLCYCAVNVYALVTGYVMMGRRFRLSRLMELWLQVVCTALLITAGASLFVDVTPAQWLASVFPVTGETYWYFTAYFALYLLIPFLNRALEALSGRECRLMLAAAVFLFTLLPTAAMGDPFKLEGGYHVLWLMVLYCIGFSLRRFGFGSAGKHAWLILSVCVLLTWLSQLGAEWLALKGASVPVELLLHYTSPTMLLASVAALSLFDRAQLSPRSVRVVSALSPLAFGVYLFHDHPLIRENLLLMRMAPLAQLPAVQLALQLAGAWIVLFAVCLLADALRAGLFRLLGVRRLCSAADARLRAWADKHLDTRG